MREARAAACQLPEDSDFNILDLDFENPIPTMCSLLCKRLRGVSEVLDSFVASPAKWHGFLQDHYVESREQVKMKLLETFFGGRPVDQNPMFWRLQSD
eukprot:4968379-Pyramimonas_sp.AAC.1